MNTSRRRFISICAASLTCAGMPGVGFASKPLTAQLPAYRWQGVAMGAEVSLMIYHADAQRIVEQSLALIQYYERLFSLYHVQSHIRRLNQNGYLDKAEPDFIALVHLAQRIHDLTDGAFDITMQPLWSLYRRDAERNRTPSAEELSAVLALVDSRDILVAGSHVRFAKTGQQMSFNGIAQGFITDRIRNFLREQGVEHALVNMGEYAALGHHAQGRAWQLSLTGREEPLTLALSDGEASATSHSFGSLIGEWSADQSKQIPHIIDPRTGEPIWENRQVTVVADSAALADALSTAAVVMPREQVKKQLARIPGVHRVIV